MARRKRHKCPSPTPESSEDDDTCDWDGTVNFIPEDDGLSWTDESDADWEESEMESDLGMEVWDAEVEVDESEEEEEEEELDPEDQALLQELRDELHELQKPTAFEQVMKPKTQKQWSKAEGHRGLGYNGLADRTKREHAKKARDKEELDAKTRQGDSAKLMHRYFAPTQPAPPKTISSSSRKRKAPSSPILLAVLDDDLPPLGYLSDETSSDDDDDENADDEDEDDPLVEATFRIRKPPARKRQKREISYRDARKMKRKIKKDNFKLALTAITKLLDSKRKREGVFDGGPRALQYKRASAIESCLRMVVRNDRTLKAASRIAAESVGLAVEWGSRTVREWVAVWVRERELPRSRQGIHAKRESILDDPEMKEGMAAYLRSHKWVTDPDKFKEFTNGTLLPDVVREYAEREMEPAMLNGLKQYIEEVLLPGGDVRLKKGGISRSTAMRCMKKLGFGFNSISKDVFYDGHERPDVKADLHNRFIPTFDSLRPQLVEYVVRNVQEELDKSPQASSKYNYVNKRLVLVPQDEMTAQAHDGKKKMWGPVGEQPLRHKGVDRGMHQSEVICSTVGHLKDAGEDLEYGKNYEGYWNGEKFCEQLRKKIIPTFEATHGAGYRAVFLIDNSQGHSAYADDALIASRMNLNPGGKQARMRDGWFIKDGQRVSQSMCFPPDHPTHPHEPKGMKVVLQERGLWTRRYVMKCGKGCPNNSTSCCARRILENQPDFLAQNSLVHEIIDEAGHICLMLPKYHCELNFIEFFWGAVKKYLRDHCDYTFDTLKENMAPAMASVQLETIRRWEHRMYRWIDAVTTGMDWVLRMHRRRLRSLALRSTSLIVVFLRL